MRKKAQISIFVIIAIVIVAAILVVLYFPKIKQVFSSSSPDIRIKECFQTDLEDVVKTISEQGGSFSPENYYLYKGEKLEYLCYTNQNFKTCSMQVPLLKQKIEKEILENIRNKIDSCIDSAKQDLVGKGYTIEEGSRQISLNILPNKIAVKISGISFQKQDTGAIYNNFNYDFSSQLYNLVMITSSILNFETVYGDSEISTYMIYYPDIKVEKLKQEDGSKVYILTPNSGDRFVFATRSLSWPGGYASSIYTPQR